MTDSHILNCSECRDRAILAGLAVGHTWQVIAEELFMSLSNVSFRIRIMCARWNVPTAVSLVAKAYANRVLLAEEWPPVAAPHTCSRGTVQLHAAPQ